MKLHSMLFSISLAVLLAAPVFAYDITEVDGDEDFGDAQILLGWEPTALPLPFALIDGDGPGGFVNPTQWRQAVFAAFDAWENVDTSTVRFTSSTIRMNTTDDPGSFSAVRTLVGRAGPPTDDGIDNVVAAVNSNWSAFGFPSSALAVTWFVYDLGTRRIGGADIFLNATDKAWAVDGRDGAYDVQNVITHEVGHFIGIGHAGPGRGSSTMWPTAGLAETQKRVLAPDDRNAVSYLYPRSTWTYVAPDRNRLGLIDPSSFDDDSGGGGGGGTLPPGDPGPAPAPQVSSSSSSGCTVSRSRPNRPWPEQLFLFLLSFSPLLLLSLSTALRSTSSHVTVFRTLPKGDRDGSLSDATRQVGSSIGFQELML